jgi:hypothetical protein
MVTFLYYCMSKKKELPHGMSINTRASSCLPRGQERARDIDARLIVFILPPPSLPSSNLPT